MVAQAPYLEDSDNAGEPGLRDGVDMRLQARLECSAAGRVGVERRIAIRRILRAARYHIDVKPTLIGEVPCDRLRGDSVAGTLEGMTGAAENVGQRSCIAGRIVD